MLMLKFCEHCMNDLGVTHNHFHNLFKNICIEYANDGQPIELDFAECYYDPEFIQTIEYLEHKGFIISTESDLKLIQIKPLGMTCQEVPEFNIENHNKGIFTHTECHICPRKGHHL